MQANVDLMVTAEESENKISNSLFNLLGNQNSTRYNCDERNIVGESIRKGKTVLSDTMIGASR